MLIFEKGVYREATAEEIAELNSHTIEIAPYEQRVQNRIHEMYSLDDEIAMLWKDPTDPEVVEYRAYVEKIKSEEKWKMV